MQNEPVKPQYYTADQVADIMQVKRSTVYEWERKHVGPPQSKVGRTIRYPIEAFKEWKRKVDGLM